MIDIGHDEIIEIHSICLINSFEFKFFIEMLSLPEINMTIVNSNLPEFQSKYQISDRKLTINKLVIRL